jgi:restriction system protein
MSVLDVAADQLQTAGGPLTVKELTALILASGAWSIEGKTPSSTVESRLAVDIKKHGEASRFVRVAARTYALRAWPAAVAASNLPTKQVGTLTYLAAAEKVLQEEKDREPLSYRTITERALTKGYLAPSGLTPEATMYVQLMTDVKRRTERGDEPRFWQLPKGRFGLAMWRDADLVAMVGRHNRDTKKALRARVSAMDWKDFEVLVGELLTKLGFEDVVVTKPSDDGGIDVLGTLVTAGVVRRRMAVQVKRWAKNVQAPTVQQLRGALGAHEQGLIITTSDFSAGAREDALQPNRAPVALMNGEELIGLLVQHEIGVTRRPLDLLELPDAAAGGPGEDEV